MVRSMYSGVSGMRTHQTRMDTIGNNIANVNTYGFKSARTTFRDIYYQNVKSASAPTAGQGGSNPSQVGYGSQVGSVDLMMSRSTFSMTDQTMDVAVDGDGFLQVMDGAGNIYYTRAGMLNFDAVGNLVDMQGNYVLGVNGDPTGRAPGSERISVSLPNVNPTAGSVEETINGVPFRISASNNTKDGNVNFNFSSDTSLTDGVPAVASISSTGIVVTFNANETFRTMADVNAAINNAILAANGGQPHVGGQFTLECTDPAKNPFSAANLPPEGYLTGAQLASTDYNIQYGKVGFTSNTAYFGGIKPSGKVGTAYSGDGALSNFQGSYTAGTPNVWTFTMEVNGVEYRGEVDSNKSTSGKFNMYRVGGDSNDYIEMDRPSFNSITTAWESDAMVPGTKASYGLVKPAAAITAGQSIVVAGITYNFDPTVTNLDDQWLAVRNAIKNDPNSLYDAEIDAVSGELKLTAKKVGLQTPPVFTVAGAAGTINNPDNGSDNEPLQTGKDFGNAYATGKYQPLDGTSKPSGKSYALGLSAKALTLKGGTAGGPQGLADMTGIAISGNGVIVGLDSQGKEVYIGRIDLATFANQSGLTQSGSSKYQASQNSGVAKLTQPGSDGAGKLVGGTLELSNVDLSREFSDMITTQRGYQANSRIITVSDTMLEELINLKR